MAKRLPTTLQLQFAESKCLRLNPNCDQVDFRAEIDNSLTFGENMANLESNHPELNWSEAIMGPKTLEQANLWEAENLVDEFSYGILKKSKIKSLERAVGRSERLKRKLEACQTEVKLPRKTPKGVCATPSVFVESHYRCPPRRG